MSFPKKFKGKVINNKSLSKDVFIISDYVIWGCYNFDISGPLLLLLPAINRKCGLTPYTNIVQKYLYLKLVGDILLFLPKDPLDLLFQLRLFFLYYVQPSLYLSVMCD